MKTFNLHLVSDSTGETVSSVARAAVAQFDSVDPEEFIWSLVRTKSQVERVLEGVKQNPGFVMYTIVDKELRRLLKRECEKLKIPCVSVLSRVISDLSIYLEMKTSKTYPGKQHELDEDYFARVEAINFTLAHDDGQSVWDLDEADIIIIGVSRTSKSPTSVYLANRGYRTANIPFVGGVPLPDGVEGLVGPMIIGLTISPDRLVQIRKNRLLALMENNEMDYVDIDSVEEEVREARRIFSRNKWPVIDVTKRSVEETAATILQYYNKFRNTGGSIS